MKFSWYLTLLTAAGAPLSDYFDKMPISSSLSNNVACDLSNKTKNNITVVYKLVINFKWISKKNSYVEQCKILSIHTTLTFNKL